VPESPVILWDFNKKTILHVFKGLKNGITNLSFSPDDRFICATSKYIKNYSKRFFKNKKKYFSKKLFKNYKLSFN
jgi:WD40 repeat protein